MIITRIKYKTEEIIENRLLNMSKESYNEVYEKLMSWLSEENMVPYDVSDDITIAYLQNYLL